jgi:hypothetical protein
MTAVGLLGMDDPKDLSPSACLQKAWECRVRSETLTNPILKDAMLEYCEWWTKLAKVRQKQSDK